ncbi:MAG: sugar phosphate isomerase/epimerase family protein [Candidatus Sigynarchaeum springense]
MPKNILSCRVGSYGPFAMHAYEHLAEIGVHFIETGLPQGSEAIELLKDMLGEFKIQVASFQVGFDPLGKDFQKQIDEAIAACDAFGTKVIFTSIKGEKGGAKKNEKLFAQLRVLGDQVKPKGIKVCLETHPELVLNGKVGKATMEAINHDAIRMNFDTANMYYYNKGIDSSVELDHLIKYVGSVHLKETDGKFHSWCFPALGDKRGVVKFPVIVKKLNDAGFFGPWTMEIEGVKGEKLTLELAKKRVADSVAYLRTIGDF